MLFRNFNSEAWSKVGFHKALSKAISSTTWVWSLHSDAHDYNSQLSSSQTSSKIFSSNIAHLSVVFFWLAGMHLHGAYFSTYHTWLKDPKHSLPSAQSVWPLVGQDILNAEVGAHFQGIYITSGLFSLWRSDGIVTNLALKDACAVSLIATLLSLMGSFLHLHLIWPETSLYKKFRSLSVHHLSGLFGLGSLSFSGHQIHISVPTHRLLLSGVDPASMPCPQELLNLSELSLRYHSSGFNSSSSILGSSGKLLAGASILLSQVAAHHFYVGVVCLLSGLICHSLRGRAAQLQHNPNNPRSSWTGLIYQLKWEVLQSWNAQLSINLAITGSLSIVFAHLSYALPVYPYCATDYPTVLCLFTHHMWIGGYLILGAGAHGSIFLIRDYASDKTLGFEEVLTHRDIIVGHLIWVTVALGLHSFGLYIHNDTLQALGRPEDVLCDTAALQLKPIFACLLQTGPLSLASATEVLDGKLVRLTQDLGTADFLVHHIHAFTIHTTLLILVKGVLYARSTRLVSDKLELGFRFPCDGPGRGGTCQLSAWDHIYLAVFWMYNALSVAIFHYFWKMQSDVWGSYKTETLQITHLTDGYSVNSTTINGWLTNFLWSQAAQVIQTYGTYLSGYGLVFIGAHFLWALSLMFLYSGRGYWQELIESLLWAHHKLKLVPFLQPRALSITQGRAVGLTHYVCGGTACTWAFFISRIISVS
jgi:photosystem I P700 chlorophyll a apoprotein A1